MNYHNNILKKVQVYVEQQKSTDAELKQLHQYIISGITNIDEIVEIFLSKLDNSSAEHYFMYQYAEKYGFQINDLKYACGSYTFEIVYGQGSFIDIEKYKQLIIK